MTRKDELLTPPSFPSNVADALNLCEVSVNPDKYCESTGEITTANPAIPGVFACTSSTGTRTTSHVEQVNSSNEHDVGYQFKNFNPSPWIPTQNASGETLNTQLEEEEEEIFKDASDDYEALSSIGIPSIQPEPEGLSQSLESTGIAVISNRHPDMRVAPAPKRLVRPDRPIAEMEDR
ncbi:unnamed protein product [Mesocestoides corti]|uniref:Uncharacterized protein n=1 Tax=Mesocestoides corti TaxID=53468 RepID=A0A0R3U2R1_MESCO|nr:unnamed protein product [Mesocestoides corti]